MPKRRRLLNSPRKTPKRNSHESSPVKTPVDRVVRTARGRLMGALLEVLEADDSEDEKYITSRSKRQEKEESSEEDKRQASQRQSYVLKLFDRSVDLSQFTDDSPLYPICRAWIANQPKANYKDFGATKEGSEDTNPSLALPLPEGPPITRIPELLPEQKVRSKDHINLDYEDTALPTREVLLRGHLSRWAGVRRAWLQQAAKTEARYEATQLALNEIYANGAT